MGDLRGQSVVVTGASSGIGAAIVRALAAAGARLTLGARRVDRLEALAHEVGGEVAVARTDMRVEADVVRLVATARERFGGVDALVNNAGLGRKAPVSSAPTELWREMLETNVLGLAHRDARGHPGHGATRRRRARRQRVVDGGPSRAWAGLGRLRRYEVRRARDHRGTPPGAARAQEPDPRLVRVAGLRRHRVRGGVRRAGGTPQSAGITTLSADDVARAVVWVLAQPPHVEVHDVLVRPTAQRN